VKDLEAIAQATGAAKTNDRQKVKEEEELFYQ